MTREETYIPMKVPIAETAVLIDRQRLAPFGLLLRDHDHWLPAETAPVLQAVSDLCLAARWTPPAFSQAMGGTITLIRDRDHPITTDAAGVRYPILGLYDAAKRALTINNWSYDARTGGEEGGRRVLLHELGHAWDGTSGYQLSRWLALLPGARASAYASASRFEDWADAVMGAVYGADPGFERFDQERNGAPSWRLWYVRQAFARYRHPAKAREQP